jgi:hypothetical protein
MTTDDHEQFSADLGQILSFWGGTVTEFALDVWWGALKRHDLKAIRSAFSRHARDTERGRFEPKPADVLRFLEGPTSSNAARAWASVTKAVAVVGGWNSVVFDDAVIHLCIVDLGGWTKVCETQIKEWDFVGQRFKVLYEGHRDKLESAPHLPYLGGRYEAHNTQKGHVTPVTMIGDPDRCRAVMTSGKDGGLQISMADQIGNLLENLDRRAG